MLLQKELLIMFPRLRSSLPGFARFFLFAEDQIAVFQKLALSSVRYYAFLRLERCVRSIYLHSAFHIVNARVTLHFSKPSQILLEDLPDFLLTVLAGDKVAHRRDLELRLVRVDHYCKFLHLFYHTLSIVKLLNLYFMVYLC